jgi:outer membrane lipoprotein SlyB
MRRMTLRLWRDWQFDMIWIAILSIMLLLAVLAGCSSQSAQSTRSDTRTERTTETTRPDGTTEKVREVTDTFSRDRRASMTSLDKDGAAGFFGTLMESELGKMLGLGLVGGGGGVAVLGAVINFLMGRAQKARIELEKEKEAKAREDAAWDESAARKEA